MYKELKINSSISGSYSAIFVNSFITAIDSIENHDNCVYIIDKRVFELHFANNHNDLFVNNYILLESTENTKTLEYVSMVISELLKMNFKRDKILVAVGGGVIQDITAFLSSILFRGVTWYFIPTTLLAQCDSCIGSKSSINFMGYKNLLGTFNPPIKILICTDFLETLPEIEIRSGIGEMFHYFYTVGFEDADNLANEFSTIIIDKTKLIKYIFRSLEIKKNIIEIDEFDTGVRHIFNYGHTFGHAIESITNYDICHGQAVTLGIDLANFISYNIGFIDYDTYLKIHNTISFNIPFLLISDTNIEEYIGILKKDKKNIGNKLGCILPIALGKVEKKFLEFDDKLKNLIIDYFKPNLN